MFAFRYVSEGFTEVLGIDRDRVMRDAKLVFDHLYEADIITLREAYQQARQTLSPADINLRMLDIHGNLFWLHISAVPHPENEFIVWDGMMRDISAGKKVESELIEEKRNFHNLFETIDDLMLVCDMSGNLLHTNPSVKQRLGYTSAELRELSLFDLYPRHLRTEAYRIIAHMQTEQSTTSSLPFCTKSGVSIPVEMKLFQGSWKNRKAVFGIARDTTHRQQTESALRESQQMLQLIMDTIPMSVFWKNKNTECLGCNRAFIKECGQEKAADVIGKKPQELFDAETAAALVAQDRQVVATNEPMFNILLPYRRADGTAGQHEASKLPLHDDRGRAVGVLEIWRDVTEQNQSEERLKRTLEDMERFNQLMRGRERRTLELKTEINQLLTELGRGIKYNTTSDGLG
jgi:PAS domain S-box-containing protein